MSPATSDSPFFRRAKFWRGLVISILALGFLRGFWDEVVLVVQFFYAVVKSILIKPVPIPFGYDTQLALTIVGINVAVFVFGYLIVLSWIAQFTLPVRGLVKRWLVFWRLFLYDLPFVHLHGPAVFVQGGKPTGTEEELASTKPGVALVDQYSAIVLEHERGAKVRAFGSGIVFTRRGEKMIGFVDLRKQTRSRDNVSSNTGDGIEVTTTVSTLFTLGQPPDILKVTKTKNHWVVAKITNDSSGNNTIEDFSDELEDDDKDEIDRFFNQSNLVLTVGNSQEQKPAANKDILPFAFDKERVIDAVYSRARNVKEGRLGEWTDLPLDVAVEKFRQNKLAHRSFDELHLPEDPKNFPIGDFNKEFESSVRNIGILGYQIIQHKDGQPLERGRTYSNKELLFSQPQVFKRSTGLRERGIKILSAGFGSLTPTGDVIQKSLLDNWRARLQQEADKTTAEFELQAMRVRNREHAKAQQDMIYSLSEIFQTEQYASEALAFRLYQTLEMAATQPATQRLLPEDTVEMLHHLGEWLLPTKPTDQDHPMGGEFFELPENR